MRQFKEKVYAVTKKIPPGRVATYRAIARAVGSPNACRAVGNALNENPHAPRVPCHRVVRSEGGVGGYASGTEKKIKLLKKEGVAVKEGTVNLKKFGFSFSRKQRFF